MNYKKRYIPYLIGEVLCFIAELVLFIFAILSGSAVAIALAAVASVICAIAVSWVGFKTWSASPRTAKKSADAIKKTPKEKTAPIVPKENVKKSGDTKHFELRYRKLTVEGLLRSLFCGLATASCVDFVLGLIFWINGMEGKTTLVIALLIGVLLAVTLASGAVFYFAKFKPNIQTNARRIDSLGLEERVVTMLDYQNSDSLMAKMQREDAVRALKAVNEKTIKFVFSKKIFISQAISGFLVLAMSTVAVLSAAGLLPSGKDFIGSVVPDEPPVYVPVSYIAEDGGQIDGEEEQLVLFGENAEPVEAIPEEGYTFEGWDDGHKKPSRTDKKIDHPLVLTAIFLPVEDEEGDAGDDGEGDENGDQPGGEQDGENGEPQDGQEGGEQESDNPSDSGSGKYDKANQIINGETYYREFLEEYRDKVIELLKKNPEELTEEEKAIIEAYINIV